MNTYDIICNGRQVAREHNINLARTIAQREADSRNLAVWFFSPLDGSTERFTPHKARVWRCGWHWYEHATDGLAAVIVFVYRITADTVEIEVFGNPQRRVIAIAEVGKMDYITLPVTW